MVTSTACLKASMSNSLSLLRYFMRLSEAKLQAESSKYIYSEQGFEELIRAVLLEVCHLLIMVSYCMPGSPQIQVDSAIMRKMSLAWKVSTGAPSLRALVVQVPLLAAACINSSDTRTEWLAFWNCTES